MPDDSVRLGVELREALEESAFAAAKTIHERRARAQAVEKGYQYDPTFSMFPQAAIELVQANPVLSELEGLPKDRHSELVVALRLALGLFGSLAELSDMVAGALVGVDGVRWERFKQERSRLLKNEIAPYMWSERVLNQEPPKASEAARAVAALPRDARTVLSVPKLLRRRQSVTQRRLVERTLLSPMRVESAIATLASAGLVAEVTLGDRLAMTTVPRLKELAKQEGIAPRGTKEVLVSRLVEELAGERIADWLKAVAPAANEPNLLTVGLGDKSLDWLMDYSELIAHFALFVTYRQREVVEARSASSFAEAWSILKTDDCAICAQSPDRVPFSEGEALPPFHIGCRCASAVDVRA